MNPKHLINVEGSTLLHDSPVSFVPSVKISHRDILEREGSRSTPELISEEISLPTMSSPSTSRLGEELIAVSLQGNRKLKEQSGCLGETLRKHELNQKHIEGIVLQESKSNISPTCDRLMDYSIRSPPEQSPTALSPVDVAPSTLSSGELAPNALATIDMERVKSFMKNNRNPSIEESERPMVYSAIGSLENSFEHSKEVSKKVVNEINKKALIPLKFVNTKKERKMNPPPNLRKTLKIHNIQKGKSTQILKSSNSEKKKKKVQISKEAPVEMFRPVCDAYTPRINSQNTIPSFTPAEERAPQAVTQMGTIHRPNFSDALRRVAIIIHQHIVKLGRRFSDKKYKSNNLFSPEMAEVFSEKNFATPRYKCLMVRIPMAQSGVMYNLREIDEKYTIPTVSEIYDFAFVLFEKVKLSSECSIVCLIYIERLMEQGRVPLLVHTWRPIFICGLLLASKVWQDLSSWNIEFSTVYPQYSRDAINKMELLFLKSVKWDLHIPSSLYAKYYFTLRSLVEKKTFRQRYNQMLGIVGTVDVEEAMKVQQRTRMVKEEALSQYSRSM